MTTKILRLFPNLQPGTYKVKSAQTKRYNCIAWAVGVDTIWWQPKRGYYWPKRVPYDDTVDAVRIICERQGFIPCGKDASFEIGFLKIAIYGDPDGAYLHAAKQLKNGKWSSKLGKLQDIEHDTLESLHGDEYGEVSCVLKKRCLFTQICG